MVSEKPNFVFIIQARTGSTRLPEKMLMPFYEGLAIPEIIIIRLQRFFPDNNIIVATTKNPKDDLLVSKLRKYSVEIFKGSEDDVLDRFVKAGKQYGAENFVRVCADNPFVDVLLLEELVANFSDDIDYVSHRINGKPAMKTGLGFFAEFSKISILEEVQKRTHEKCFTEHVTNYIYESSDFNLKFIDVPDIIAENDQIRLTVDTKEDFEMASEVYQGLIKLGKDINYKNVIEWIKKSNFIAKMVNQSNLNRK